VVLDDFRVPPSISYRVLCGLFIAYVVATALHIFLVSAHEPFASDAWNVMLDTRAEPPTLSRFLGYIRFEYTTANPRLGQYLTYLAYKLAYVGPVAIAISYLALALAVTVIGLGRWPGGRTASGARTPGRDLAMIAIAIGFAWFAIPRIGKLMFCSAYATNYLFGAAVQLWFLVVVRLVPRGEARRAACVAYAALGVAAGMCNEHTGPTLVLFMFGYAVWRERDTGRRPWLVWAGAIGSAAGFLVIFFAPGQGSRYDGLATRNTLIGKLLRRGVIENLEIFREWMLACAPILALIVIVLIIARRPRRDQPAVPSAALDAPIALLGVVLAAGSLIAITVFVSPKLGARFYFHGCALVLAAFLGIADQALPSARRLAPFVVLAVCASIYAGCRTLPLYYRLSAQSDARLAAIQATPRGAVFTAESFEQIDDTWWYLGDDFTDTGKRDMVAAYYGFKGVILRANDLNAPLGVSDVQLVPRYQVTPASCLDEHGGLELGSYRGFDITAVHRAIEAAIDRLRARLGPQNRLDQLDIAVEFAGSAPPLPRPQLVVGRWRPTGFEHYATAIERRTGSTTRSLKLPAGLAGQDVEIYAYQVRGEARRLGNARTAAPGQVFEYVPWGRGVYWALACRPTECFVIAVARLL
jgi:hypothetical protein